MARVTGLGGVFFKAPNADTLRDWYRDQLGVAADEYGGLTFEWRDKEAPEKAGKTVLMPFPSDTSYFDPSRAPFMLNFRVDNLDEMLAQLKSAGVENVGTIEEYDYGRFAWIMDPAGHRIELWEPPVGTAGRAEPPASLA